MRPWLAHDCPFHNQRQIPASSCSMRLSAKRLCVGPPAEPLRLAEMVAIVTLDPQGVEVKLIVPAKCLRLRRDSLEKRMADESKTLYHLPGTDWIAIVGKNGIRCRLCGAADTHGIGFAQSLCWSRVNRRLLWCGKQDVRYDHVHKRDRRPRQDVSRMGRKGLWARCSRCHHLDARPCRTD